MDLARAYRLSHKIMKFHSLASPQHPLKLYSYWRSSASWRVRWALELKKIPYEIVPVNLLKEENKSSEHKKRNPAEALPVLELEKDIYLSESVAIFEWIEEVYALSGPSLFPGTPLERARIRQLMEIINSGVGPLQTPRVQKRHSEDPAERSLWATEWIRSGLQTYWAVARASWGRYSVYDMLSAADLFLVPQLYNAKRYGIELAKEFPEFEELYERLLKSEEGAKTRPEAQIDAP
jgi:maleylacetoacetate isomerase